MRSLYDPLPCRERALSLRLGLKEKLIQSLDYLLEVNKRDLSSDYKKGKALLDEIVNAQKLSGFAFAFNTLLLNSTLEEDLSKVIPYFSLLEGRLALDEIQYHHYRETPEENQVNQLFKQYILNGLPSDTPIREASSIDPNQVQNLVHEALRLIEKTDEASYLELQELVTEFIFFEAGVIKAGSSFDLFGLISFNAVNAQYSVINAAELIIHETAHLYLYAVGTEDPLVTNDFEESYYSPLRGVERPMLGLYHAVFVLSRVIRFLKLLDENIELSLEYKKEAKMLILKYQSIVSESLMTIKSHAKLSDLARELIAC